ncbi:hypothetical protein ABR748_38375, partial [Streptomyces microflavus]
VRLRSVVVEDNGREQRPLRTTDTRPREVVEAAGFERTPAWSTGPALLLRGPGGSPPGHRRRARAERLAPAGAAPRCLR